MKSVISKTIVGAVVCATLLSFSPAPGGEGFEIYLGNKLLTQQFGSKINEVKSLQIDQAAYNEQLIVKYYHCGRIGKHRVITIKDEQDKVLKEFRFADWPAPVNEMSCKVKDIISLKKGSSTILKLYYSSSELPNGRLLASIVSGNALAVRH